MTKKEREYLRSAYLSLQDKISGYPTTDLVEANRSARAGSILREVVFNVLCLAGDEDGEVKAELDDLFENNNIEYLGLDDF